MSFAQDLRASVLQAAMQGKLTEQLETDSSVCELLKKIRTQKQQLISDKKIKKEKPLTPISDEDIPFEIPESWEWVKHNEFFDIVGGSQPPKSDFSEVQKDGFVRLYQIRDYGDKPVPVYVDKNKVTKFSQKGDIILARYGASGKVFWAENGAYNVALAKSVPKFYDGEIYKPFIYYYYSSSIYKNVVCKVNRVAVDGFNKDDIANMLFPLPPFEEQKRIVRRIEEIMTLIDELEAIEEELKKLKEVFPANMKAAVLQAAMQGKLTEQLDTDSSVDELLDNIKAEREKLVSEGKMKKLKTQNNNFVALKEAPFDIPNHWKWAQFKDVVVFLNGRAYKQHEMLEFGKYPLLRVGNFFTNDKWYYSDLELDEDKYCDNGDLLYAWSASFGPKIWDKNKSIFHYHIWKIKYDQLLFDKKYLYYYFLFDKEKISSATRGLTMVHISMTVMNERYIAIPPIEEQRRIVDKLETILPLIEDI